MKRIFAACAVLAVMLTMALPVWAGGCIRGVNPRVQVVGQTQLKLPPDQVVVYLGVETKGDSAQQAADQNAAIMKKVRAAVKAALGDAGQMQTAEYSLRPRRQWDPKTKTQKELGYVAVNRIKVTSRQVKQIGGVLDAASRAGANRLNGPTWGIADMAAARSKVQVLAVKDAKVQADALAAEAGMKLGPVLSINTGGDMGPRPMRAMAASPRLNSAPPMEPGLVELQARVTVVFEMLPPR